MGSNNVQPTYEELLAMFQEKLNGMQQEIDSLKQENSQIKQDMKQKVESLEQENFQIKQENLQIKGEISNAQNILGDANDILHNVFDLIYNVSKDAGIERSLTAMGNIGKTTLGVEECTVYNIDSANKRLYTSNEQGDREYISPSKDSMIQLALSKKQPLTFNQLNESIDLGDGKQNNSLHTKNAIVIPLENRFGDTIGVAIAKGKESGFEKEDIDAFFSAKLGSVGNFFRVAIESKTNSLQATTDKLTSLNNRQGMENFIKANITSRINREQSVSVAVFDIDKFKNFNDTYGHSVGDDCLKQVANIIKDNLRATKETGAFRFGGEEFIAIVPTNELQAKDVIDRVRKAVENTPLRVGDKDVKVTVSAGVAQMQPNTYGLTNEETIKLFDETFVMADTALYHSKENGRNQVTASYEVDPQKLKETVMEYQNKQEKSETKAEVKEVETPHFSRERTEMVKDIFDLVDITITEDMTKDEVQKLATKELLAFDKGFVERVQDYASGKGQTFDNVIDYLNENEDVKQRVIHDGYDTMYSVLDTICNHFDEVNLSEITNKGEKIMSKDFSVNVSNEEDYIMPNDQGDGINVYVESVGASHLENMLYEAVKSNDISQEVADEVLSNDSGTYYDVYVELKADGNDSVTLAITTEDGDKYYSNYSGDNSIIEKVADEVRERENATIDEVINEFEKDDMER